MLSRLVFVTLVTVLLGCSGSGDSSNDGGKAARKEILTFWADEIIIPGYDHFDGSLEELVDATDAFTETPTIETLNTLREKWVSAYIEWQNVELFDVGPAYNHSLRGFFNIYPVDVAGINAAIDNPSVNLEVFSSYTKQGFPALDYLINGLDSDDAGIVALYATDAKAAARKVYLKKLVTRMDNLLQEVRTEWNSYRDTFVSRTGMDNVSSFPQVVNAFSLNYERFIRTGKIGIPSGATASTGGEAFPEKVEAYYKRDISGILALEAHNASHRFFNGKVRNSSTAGPSFRSYLDDDLNVKDETTGLLLSAVMEQHFNAITEKLEGLDPDFFDEVQNNNAAVVEVHTKMQELVAYIKVDMVQAMNVTIIYADNDGD